MEQKSMTALISAFARWYHAAHNSIKIFDDSMAGEILSDDEKQQISASMSNGIGFFNPSFTGTSEEALRWIVDNQLSPSTLGRSAWAERALRTAVQNGVRQYAIVAAGYDTFAYRQPAWARELQVYEFDTPHMSADKQIRVQKISGKQPGNLAYIPIDLNAEPLSEKIYSCAGYDKNKLSMFSLLGISYYLSKENFKAMLQDIASAISDGSTIVFDYPDEKTHTGQMGERVKRQAMLASGAKEAMLASYSYAGMEQLLSGCGFLIYEHLMPDEITNQYFTDYNNANPQHLMTAFDNVNYCLAVRKKAGGV